MSVSVTYERKCTVAETLTLPSAGSTKKVVTHDQFNTSKTLNSGSTPPATKVACFEMTLSAGAYTIDLTAVPGSQGNVDFTGLKIQVLSVKNKSGNAVMTFGEGASDGYELAGNGWKMAVLAEQEFAFYGHDAAPDVASGAKAIDVAGTGSQIAEVTIVGG